MITKESLQKGIIVWGTGKISREFSEGCCFPILYYIDNDDSKKDSLFLGKKTFSPEKLELQDKKIIVIATKYDNAIKEQCEKLGLVKGVDFVFYSEIVDIDALMIKYENEFLSSISMLEMHYRLYAGANIIVGGMVSFDENSVRNLDEAFWCLEKEDSFIFVSETDAIKRKAQSGLIGFPFICLPAMLQRDVYIHENMLSSIEVSEEIREYVQSRAYCDDARICFEGKYAGQIATGYAYYFAYWSDLYLKKLLNVIKPKKVAMWNKFYPFHHILDELCKEMGIEAIYLEYGVIPGTYQVEKKGQMGESLPAVKPQLFAQLEVSEEDKEHATEVHHYLKASRINRKDQPDSYELEAIMQRIDKNKPILVYMGQNDFESGMYPYGNHAKKFHSPIFDSSRAAAEFLSVLSDKNDWNLIYKPHPICIDNPLCKLSDEHFSNAYIVNKCNINDLVEVADLNITILSTAAYVALIQRKPVLMLGYTQLYQKGCTYEALKKDMIEDIIKKALLDGHTEEQRRKFLVHLAQLLKYYLYDNNTDRPIRYGISWRNLLIKKEMIF